MSDATYREALTQARAAHEAAQVRLLRAESERAAAVTELSNLRRTIAALAVMCGEKVDGESIGLTEAVRAAMNSATKPLTLAEAREAVEAQGFDWSTQSDPDASLSSVLRRLREAGEVRHVISASSDDGSIGSILRRRAVWLGKNVAEPLEPVHRPPTPVKTGTIR